MAVEDAVEDVKHLLLKLEEKIPSNIVTWKDLATAGFAFFAALCTAVWFVVGVRMDNSLTAKLQEFESSLGSTNAAAFQGVEDRLKTQLASELETLRQGLISKADITDSINDAVSRIPTTQPNPIPFAYYTIPNSELNALDSSKKEAIQRIMMGDLEGAQLIDPAVTSGWDFTFQALDPRNTGSGFGRIIEFEGESGFFFPTP